MDLRWSLASRVQSVRHRHSTHALFILCRQHCNQIRLALLLSSEFPAHLGSVTPSPDRP